MDCVSVFPNAIAEAYRLVKLPLSLLWRRHVLTQFPIANCKRHVLLTQFLIDVMFLPSFWLMSCSYSVSDWRHVLLTQFLIDVMSFLHSFWLMSCSNTVSDDVMSFLHSFWLTSCPSYTVSDWCHVLLTQFLIDVTSFLHSFWLMSCSYPVSDCKIIVNVMFLHSCWLQISFIGT